MNTTDQDRYNKLADWAESDDREIHPDRGSAGEQAQERSREILRRAAGRPSLDPAAEPGKESPRRQVRLPKMLSNRVDELAANDDRKPAVLMRDAINLYVTLRDVAPTLSPQVQATFQRMLTDLKVIDGEGAETVRIVSALRAFMDALPTGPEANGNFPEPPAQVRYPEHVSPVVSPPHASDWSEAARAMNKAAADMDAAHQRSTASGLRGLSRSPEPDQ